MNIASLMPLIAMAAFGAFAIYSMKKRAKGCSPDATQHFLEQTGYRYCDILEHPLPAHVAHADAVMRNARGGGYSLHMVRNYLGTEVHSRQGITVKNRYTSYSNTWSTPLPSPAQTVLQIADKSLSGLSKAAWEALSDHTRCWKPVYPTALQSGDVELDQRFVFYGVDPAAVRAILHQPGLRELLLGCGEVDLVIQANWILFADPQQKNLRAIVPTSTMVNDPSKTLELKIPLENHIAQLLSTMARLSTQPLSR